MAILKNMTFDEIAFSFPLVVFVVGEKWLRKNDWCDEEYISTRLEHYKRLENDLKSLEAHVRLPKLKSTYNALLRDKNSFWNILYEIHGIALVSKVASRLELKIPLGGVGNKDFDARVNISGTSVNIECTTRRDEFPFYFSPMIVGPNKIPVYSGTRATVDPHDTGVADYAQETNHIAIPEATVIRQALLDKLSQLPAPGINLILLGQRAGSRGDLETALFGPVSVDFWCAAETREVESAVVQLPHGAYDTGANGNPFRQLSGVLWFGLFSVSGPEYKLYPNPNATSPLSQDVVAKLESAMPDLRPFPSAL